MAKAISLAARRAALAKAQSELAKAEAELNQETLHQHASALAKIKAWDVEPEDLVTFVEAFRKHGRESILARLRP
jgi:Tfp pilus assembly protein PilX